MEEELLLIKKEAAAAEQRFTAEISTVTKLLELYKESSNEWSKKAGELEGVIKALEVSSIIFILLESETVNITHVLIPWRKVLWYALIVFYILLEFHSLCSYF